MDALFLVASGLNNREIARELGYSMGNIKHRILVKLGVENCGQAAERTLEIELIPPPC